MKDNQVEAFNALDIFGIFRRQLRLMLLTIGIVLGAALIYLAQATPLYTATTLLIIDPAGKNLLAPDATMPNSNSDSAKIESEVEILKSDSLALKTIRDSKLYLTDEFGPSLGTFDKIKMALGFAPPPAPEGDAVLQAALQRFESALSVRRMGLTYLISVSVTSESPDRAARLANEHAKTYLADQVSSKVDSSLAAGGVLQGQLQQARQKLAASDGALTSYIQNHLDQLQAETGSTKIAELRTELQTANSQIAKDSQAADLARTALQSGDWDKLASQVQDETIAKLAQQKRTFEQQLAGAEPGSAAAIDIAAGLADINRQLTQAGQQTISQLEKTVQSEKDSTAEITKSIRDEVLGSTLTPETLADIYGLQQDAQIAQRQYDTLLTRLRDVQTQALVQVADARVVSQALSPQQKSYPNTELALALALVLGLGLGAGLALSNEYLFGGVTSEAQLNNIVPARVAAVVPKVSSASGQLTFADKVVDEPMSLFSESFRKLRASIDRQSPATPGIGRVILFTSSIPAEGKSTDALALARTYALAGKRTLLVDADLRKPSQHTFIGTEPESGILEYLTAPGDRYADAACFGTDPKSNLGLIMGRRRSSIPTDAPLQTEGFANLIMDARKSFDVVIMDSAPLVPVVDARYISPFADVVVLCVRFGLARQADVRTAFEQLEESISDGAVIMTSLNCLEGKTADYRYSGYYGYATS
ncbi:MAG: hypothetical protein GC146_00375 [Limimaricola sp.]|uniref:GumC family protein n=1 Tax=Limimaricola sp. TaxID=2211665 RepID=UPI001DB2AC6D|nr:Wzz/FepE/Etk N-terminal domain-containing protein [Limimaricola sp.]MBI1415657.1 hypothetical protein [Limimaricola sp.]